MIIARGRLLFDGTPAELEARSPRHNAVIVSLAADAAAAAQTRFAALPDVAGVDRLSEADGWSRLLVLPRPGRVIVAEVARVAQEARFAIGGLEVERGHLDEVFRGLTAGGERAA